MIFQKERYQKIAADFEKWWAHELERPIIQVTLSGTAAGGDFFASDYRREILDACYTMDLPAREVVQKIEKSYQSVAFYGDAFPVFYMRPTGIMGAFLGQEYGIDRKQGTVWFKKTGQELDEIAGIRLDKECQLFNRAIELTHEVQDYFKGEIAVGVPDLGGVYDILSSIRDANELLLELCMEEDAVKEAAWNIHEQFKIAYDAFQGAIDPEKIPGYTCWATMLSQKPYYVLQNDFSAMISSEMFDDFYLPILEQECKYIPRTIYHLDGPGAVRHLESIVSIKELDGVQWINGAGSAGLDQWPDIYKTIIGAGKLCQVFINGSDELRYIDDIVDIVGTTKDLCFICTGNLGEADEFQKYLDKYGVK